MQLQVAEYAAPATPTHDTSSETIQVLKEAVEDVHASYLDIMEKKMHKFPPSLADVDRRYTVPATVAIGPYHHGLARTLEAEKLKNVAVNECIRESTGTLQEMYNAVSLVSPRAHNLYYPDGLAKFPNGILPIMFLDACFLVQYMRWYYAVRMDEALDNYFFANYEHICTDIMMLENQIPWMVVQAILDFMPPAPSPWLSPWEMFVIAMTRNLNNQTDDIKNKKDDIVVVPEDEPPHLLGLVWYYIVGKDETEELPLGDRPLSLSMSVAELAGIGITFKPNTNTEAGLVDMGLDLEQQPPFFGVISVQPLCLTDRNATWLVNMAAFELCRFSDFDDIPDKNSDVCSYLQLFVMLLDQKKHVHDLREKGVIQGGGLTSNETLQFFTLIGKNMRVGRSYLRIMMDIQSFREKKRIGIRTWLFIKKNGRTIAAVISAIGVVIGILSSLQALKPR